MPFKPTGKERMSMYEKLFSRGKIGNLELKSRIVMPPMGTSMACANGEASPEIIRYYEERAKAGCALICTEITCVDEETGAGGFYQLHATSPKYVQSLKKLADTMHRYDTKIFLQLHHPGREISAAMEPAGEIVAPSAIPCPVIGEVPRAMTTAEVEAMGKKFVKAAVMAKMAGMDGVELHAAHGYLLNQFMSPLTNKRTDRYGGDFVNRMRLIAEIIIGIRYACGPDFPVSVRISANEYLEGGIDLKEGVRIARYLESLGIVSINVSCGTYATGDTIVEPYYRDECWKKDLAATIKAAVKIPVIAVNTVKNPATAEKLLEDGVCDYVALGRAQLADAEWAKKAREGKEHLIRKCMGCMFCFKAAASGMPTICNANPNLGLETVYNEDTLKKNGDGRPVAIIGGGPGGMQAALVLARRGFKPVIFEKSDRLGGSMNYACKPPHKELVADLITTMENELKEENVEVRLNTEASVALVKELNPYGVIVATGGDPVRIPVPGADGDNVYIAQDVVSGKHTFSGKKIVVVGAGVTGLETAEMLSKDNDVTVIEMTNNVGEALYRSVKNYLVRTLEGNGAKIMTLQGLWEIKPGKVVLRHSATAFKSELDADAVVFATGVRPNKALTDEFYAAFDKVTTVGDATKPGLIGDALREANSKAYVF